jgi:hypothetical protein
LQFSVLLFVEKSCEVRVQVSGQQLGKLLHSLMDLPLSHECFRQLDTITSSLVAGIGLDKLAFVYKRQHVVSESVESLRLLAESECVLSEVVGMCLEQLS